MIQALILGNIITIGLTIWRWQFLPPQIPLFFSKPWGEDQLADTWMLILLPFFMNGLWFLNQYIAKRFFSDNEFVRNVFQVVNLCILIACVTIFARIILFST